MITSPVPRIHSGRIRVAVISDRILLRLDDNAETLEAVRFLVQENLRRPPPADLRDRGCLHSKIYQKIFFKFL
jgi:hypothetical protein